MVVRTGILVIAGLAAPASAAGPRTALDTASPITVVSAEQLEQLPAGQRVEDLLKTCPAQTVPTLDRKATAAASINLRGLPGPPTPVLTCTTPADIEMVEVLKVHNDTRALYGSRPLFWDPLLAAQARSYGPTLAGYNRIVHSPRAGREWSRENLLQALPGTPVRRMVLVWIEERRYFRPGVFPNVSTTGNWYVVGHLTQIIWPTTTAVGCAVQRRIGRFDWLICRYAPPGNRDGVRIGFRPLPAVPLPQPPPPP